MHLAKQPPSQHQANQVRLLAAVQQFPQRNDNRSLHSKSDVTSQDNKGLSGLTAKALLSQFAAQLTSAVKEKKEHLDFSGLFGKSSLNNITGSFTDSCNTSVCSELNRSHSGSTQSSPNNERNDDIPFPQFIPGSIGSPLNLPKQTTSGTSMHEFPRSPSSLIRSGKKGRRCQHEDGYYHPSLFLSSPLLK